MIILKLPTVKRSGWGGGKGKNKSGDQYLIGYATGVLFKSYNTHIAFINREGGLSATLDWKYSRTTTAYFRAFSQKYAPSNIVDSVSQWCDDDEILERVNLSVFIINHPVYKDTYLGKWAQEQMKTLPPEEILPYVI